MPFILPHKISTKLPMSRFKAEETTREQSTDFIFEKRKKSFRSPDKFLYRIVTRDKSEGFRTKISVGNDLAEMKAYEWHYITSTLPQLIPSDLHSEERVLWLIAHFTQKALQEKTRRIPNAVSDTSLQDMKLNKTALSTADSSSFAMSEAAGDDVPVASCDVAASAPPVDEDPTLSPSTGHDGSPRRRSRRRPSQDSSFSAASEPDGPGDNAKDAPLSTDIGLPLRPFLSEQDDLSTDDDEQRPAFQGRYRTSLIKKAKHSLLSMTGAEGALRAPTPELSPGGSPRPSEELPASRLRRDRGRNHHSSTPLRPRPPMFETVIYEDRPEQGQYRPVSRTSVWEQLVQRYGWKWEVFVLVFCNFVVMMHDWHILLFWLNTFGLFLIASKRMDGPQTKHIRWPEPVQTPGPVHVQHHAAASSQGHGRAIGQPPKRALPQKAPEEREMKTQASTTGTEQHELVLKWLEEESKQEQTVDSRVTLRRTLQYTPSDADWTSVPDSWRNTDCTTFNVRCGPNYAKNKQKSPSMPALCECLSVEVWRSDKKISHIGRVLRVPPVPPDVAQALGMPPTILVHLKAPDYAPSNPIWGGKKTNGPGFLLTMVFTLTPATRSELMSMSPSPAAALLRDFVNADPSSPLRKRFKAIARLTNPDDPDLKLGTVAKKLVTGYNATPFLLRTTSSFFLHQDYFEIDIDIHRFGYPALLGLSGVKERIAQVVADIGVVVQAEEDYEMPECMIGGASLCKLQLTNHFPLSVDPLPEDLEE